jgi:hypothetical protein
MAYATFNKPSLQFNTKLYTGNGGTQSVTGVGFQPDWLWLKKRNSSANHFLFDAVRGANKELNSNNTEAEASPANYLSSFDSDGFTIGSDSDINGNSDTHVAWNWKANGAGSANTDGTINSTVSANTTAGFSIVTWTAGSGVGSIGHGLGVAPSMIIVKGRSAAIGWVTGLKSNGWNNYLTLQSTNANNNDRRMFSPSGQSDPTSTVWYQDHAALGSSGDSMIGYVFAEKKGYSKFGTYVGNGSTDGTFIYTGFKPAFLIWKQTNTGGQNWGLFDNKRDPHNFVSLRLPPDTTDSEGSPSAAGSCDFLSNGFKWRSDFGSRNGNNGTYIYMAFAEEPLVANVGQSIPATAR